MSATSLSLLRPSLLRLSPLRLVKAPEKVNEVLRHRFGFDSLIERPQLGSDYGIGIIIPGARVQHASRAPVGAIIHFSIPRTEG
nr:hypothetical protein [Ensifer sp. BR816]